MRNNSFLIAMLLALFAVVIAACNKDDKDETVPMYSYGISTYQFSSVTTSSDSSTSTETDAEEMKTITNAFADAFKTALGVTGTPFSYNGGDDKVLAACKQVEEATANTFSS